MQIPKLKQISFEDAILYFIIGAGVSITIGQFFYNRSLWLDEAMLALNIIRKSPEDLLHPLDFYQVAPILFLQIEKMFSWIIPNSELGLRLLPLIVFLISLYLFLKILVQSCEYICFNFLYFPICVQFTPTLLFK
jgi:hypothetical protein